MALPRRLRIIIEIDDDGGPEDYDNIINGLTDLGAQVVDEFTIEVGVEDAEPEFPRQPKPARSLKEKS